MNYTIRHSHELSKLCDESSYSHIAMGRKEVLRYSMMSLWRKGGNVAKVEIIV